RYTYTNFGERISVAAPAGSGVVRNEDQVLSTVNSGATVQESDAYAWYHGTSMATPHVAGTVALVLQANELAGNDPLTPAEVQTILENTAYAANGEVTNCNTASRWCASLIDAGLAVAVASGDQPLPPTPPGPPPPPPPIELENEETYEVGPLGEGGELFFTLEVPEGEEYLTFLMAPGEGGATGDADLYVRFGDAPTDTVYDCRPYRGGVNQEVCEFPAPEAGTWHARVHAYGPVDGWTITGTYGEAPPPPTIDELENGVPVTGISVPAGEEVFFVMNVPENATNLTFAMSGGTGDADLYVLEGAMPTSSNWDCRPWLTGNNETCTFATPNAGAWYVRVFGWSTASGITLTASYTGGPGGEAPTDLQARYAFPLKGQRIRVPLSWTGGEGEMVDVKFNGETAASVANTGSFVHNFTASSIGAGSATYEVCNAGTTECSGEITVDYTARR
ncbi:MAG: S8 family serine peptidase, partial [Gammaproteobacteria bacterium]|nr:S8 family serine peptidase [Gammaproteobacteria bacterium]